MLRTSTVAILLLLPALACKKRSSDSTARGKSEAPGTQAASESAEPGAPRLSSFRYAPSEDPLETEELESEASGIGDFNSGLDDRDVFAGLLGNEVGEMAGGPGDGGIGWGTIGTGSYGTIGHGNKTPTGSTMGKDGTSGRMVLPPRVRISEVLTKGMLDKNIIRRYIRRKLPRIRHCYEKQLVAEPNLEGVIVVEFEIDTKGAVREASAHGFSKKVESCLAAAIRSIQFPKPKQGSVNVQYTFEFRPAG